MLTTLNLNDSLGLELSTLAEQTGKPLNELLEDIIAAWRSRSCNGFTVNVSVCDGIWTADCDALGLVTEADSYEVLTQRALAIAPELAELNAVNTANLRLFFTQEQSA